MSYSIDTNVLLYATFESTPQHQAAAAFLGDCRDSSEPLCLTWPVLISYLRLATHTKVWPKPLTPEAAMENVESLLSLPQTRALGEGEDFWASYRRICEGLTVRGNLISDAQIAAILLENDVRVLYTNDRDFRKFDFLEPRNPLGDP